MNPEPPRAIYNKSLLRLKKIKTKNHPNAK